MTVKTGPDVKPRR